MCTVICYVRWWYTMTCHDMFWSKDLWCITSFCYEMMYKNKERRLSCIIYYAMMKSMGTSCIIVCSRALGYFLIMMCTDSYTMRLKWSSCLPWFYDDRYSLRVSSNRLSVSVSPTSRPRGVRTHLVSSRSHMWVVCREVLHIQLSPTNRPRGVRTHLVDPRLHVWVLCREVLHIQLILDWKAAKEYYKW